MYIEDLGSHEPTRVKGTDVLQLGCLLVEKVVSR